MFADGALLNYLGRLQFRRYATPAARIYKSRAELIPLPKSTKLHEAGDRHSLANLPNFDTNKLKN